MRDDGADEQQIFEELCEAGRKDVPYGRVLSSMCTAPHPVAVKAHRTFIRTNLGDPKLFPGTAAIERKCVEMLGDLLHLPSCPGIHYDRRHREQHTGAPRSGPESWQGRPDEG